MSQTTTGRRPTRIRYLIVALTTLMAVFLYLDRFCLSFVELYIAEDLGLTKFQAGLLVSAFFWTYAFAQVPSGWLNDRYGARLMLTLYIVGWSLFTGGMGLVKGFVALILCRLGTGLAQAGAYPTSASILSKWVPFSARAGSSSIVSTGGRLGGFLAPILTAFLLVWFVPVSRDSLLTTRDVLEPATLTRTLMEDEDDPQGQLNKVIRNELPAPVKQLLQQKHQVKGRQETPSSTPVTFSEEDRQQLVVGLNEVLKRKDLYTQIDQGLYPLPEEAQWLGQRSEEEVSTEEVTRRNRLLLEVVYPDHFRKIYTEGWRPILIVYGGAGLVMALVFWLGVRNRPEMHPLCNEGEAQLIAQDRPVGVSPHGRVGGIPLGWITRSRSLWLSSLSQFGTNCGWIFLVVWLPRYLKEVHQVPVSTRGLMTSLPLLLGIAGMLGGGWLTDTLTRAVGVRWGRRIPMALTRFVAMGAYLVCLGLDSPWAVVVAMCVVAMATDLGTASVWAFMQDVGGRNVGSVLGWGNMWGNLGAAIAPTLLILIAGDSGWNMAFVACAVSFFVAGVAAMGVDATIPVVPPEVEAAEIPEDAGGKFHSGDNGGTSTDVVPAEQREGLQPGQGDA